MDLQPIQQQEATSSSTSTQALLTQEPDFSYPPTSSSSAAAESKPLRSSARVKAAKKKEKEKERDSTEQSFPILSETPRIARFNTQSSKTKRSRDSSTGKGKAKDITDDLSSRPSKRPRRATLSSISTSLTIEEPVKDIKGKKRAVLESNSEEEAVNASLESSTLKRSKTTSYALRPRAEGSSSLNSNMPRKTRSSLAKGKVATRSKSTMPAESSKADDEDVEMLDGTECKREGSEYEDQIDGHEDDDDDDLEEPEHRNEEGMREDDEGDEDTAPPAALPTSSARGFGGLDEHGAMAIFGDYRQFGSYMISFSGRLKTMLNNIKSTANPTTRLVTLQELSEVLSISTEDTLAGSFQVEQFVRELVKILGGRGVAEDEDDDGGDDVDEHDEDAALAAALAMSAEGGAYQGDENLEAQVLACRCLANLMEALPGVAHTVVYHGAIPVLCSKLIEISYIDLAEQTLSTLEKISEEFPSSIVREGGLGALLNYLDFFSIAVQRTALQAAANCCRNVSSEHLSMIRGVWPIIRNCLGYSDQRLVEFACLCVIRVIDSYYRSSTDHLETLLDGETIRAINLLLMPAGGSPMIAPNTYTLLLRSLATAARASPKITIALLEADIVDTLYQILTGILPSGSNRGEEQGNASSGQGLGGSVADMTVMENLAHRPKDQIEEALSLVSELMPPLPKDGVFDHKSYTDKALSRLVKAKAKAERAVARQLAAAAAESAVSTSLGFGSPSATMSSDPALEVAFPEGSMHDGEDMQPHRPTIPELATDRTEMLRTKTEVVGRFMQLMVPILIDVYAASVITPVRVKSLTGLLKAVCFLEGDALKRVLSLVPVASFASSILSSKDHPTLVIGALQLVDLLLTKIPVEYRATFRREGVFHEIETFANRALTSSKSKDKDKDKDLSEASSPADSGNIPLNLSATSGATLPGFKKLSSLSLDPEDAITLRARVIRFKYIVGQEQQDEDSVFDGLPRFMERISVPDASEQALRDVLEELANLFTASRAAVSSFQLLQSGVVDGLLRFATDPERTVSISRRQELLLDAFNMRKTRVGATTPTPFANLVKKLQECLTRIESFDVVTVAQGIDDSKRSSPSLLARQLRLRLVASDESDLPRNLHNIVVSIHAIATFQALNDYLRPRVAGITTTSKLSGMLAALAASGFAPATSSRASLEEAKPAVKEPETSIGESSSAATSSAAVTRRRSQRLSAKIGKGSKSADVSSEGKSKDAEHSSDVRTPVHDSEGSFSGSIPSTLMADGAPIPDIAADFTDDEVDAEVFDEEEDTNDTMEKTVSLSVIGDGSKVEAQTPDGTRVATPLSSKDALPIPTLRETLSTKTSYAAALKTKQSDWRLEFSMDDHVLPLDLTIYGAIHQHEMRKKQGPVPSNLIWQGIYTVKFRKVSGPASSSETRADETISKVRSPSPTLSSLPDDAPHTKILRLLRVLHKLNAMDGDQQLAASLEKRTLPESGFINNKLSAKLTRQLEEPMIVASSCLPDWALDLPQNFPFLFPFATRYSFLQSTSFGYARLILKWQSQQSRGHDSSRRDDGIGFLGRLQRQKVRISRKHILESAVKVFELYGSSSSVLEVEYFEEVGTGLGPTLEFYSLVSKEFARRDLKIWRDADPAIPGLYVHHPAGLYPAPISPDDIANDGGQKRTHIFRVIGQFVAKAMLDSRIIDLSFNKVFIKLILGEEVPLTLASLQLVDSDLAKSLAKLRTYASLKGQNEKLFRKVAMIDMVDVDDLALDFTLPGYDIELRPGGREMQVTAENVEDYIHDILDTIIGKGAQLQAKSFREGFSKVFPISDLLAFSADELVMLFGNFDEDWSIETLSESVKADHGFNVDSRSIRDLVETMSGYDAPTRRDYLQFITGSPKLPIGGFRGLSPPLTVVRKPHEPPLTADDYLPSVMTCVNYLKLPEYSSKAVMQEKLLVAMKEGVGSFHLS